MPEPVQVGLGPISIHGHPWTIMTRMGQALSRQRHGPYWAIHSSLYEGCRPQDIDVLEEAAQHAQRGDYMKAIDIYDENHDALDDSSQTLWLLEAADTLGRAGCEKARLWLLEENVAPANLDKSHGLKGQTILQLLDMHRAESRFLNLGTMREALGQARKLQAFLQSRAVDDYDDICVECLMAYHSFIKRVHQSSCWTEPDVDGLLPAAAAPSHLELPEDQDDLFVYRQGVILTHVRRALQARNETLLAYRLCKTESGCYQGDLSLMPFREFLAYIEGATNAKSDVIVTKMVFHHAFVAWDLADQQRGDEAKHEIGRLATRLSSIGQSLDDMETLYPRAAVYVKWIGILIDLDDPDVVVGVEQVGDLEDHARELGDFPMVRVILHKLIKISCRNAEASLIDRDETGRPEEAGDPWQFHDSIVSSYLEFEEQQMQAAYFMAAALSSIFIQLTYRGRARHAEVLQYYADFRAKFPRFDVPSLSHLLLRLATTAASGSSYVEMAADFRAERQIAWVQCPKGVPQSSRGAEQESLGHGWYTASADMGRRGGRAASPWDYLVPIVSKVLLRWLRQAALTGECSAETVSTCLGLKPTTCESGEPDGLTEIDQLFHEPTEEDYQTLSDRIFGREKVPVPYDEWDSWYASVVAWLAEHRVLGRTVAERHLLLTRLQECRVALLLYTFNNRLVSPDRDFLYELAMERLRYLSVMRDMDISLFNARLFCEERLFYCMDIGMLCTRGDSSEELRVTDDMLSVAIDDLSDNVADLATASSISTLLRATQTYEFLLSSKHMHFKTVPRLAVYLAWQDRDFIFQLARDQHSSLQGSRELMVRSTFAENHDAALHYIRGVEHAWSVWLDFIRSSRFRQPVGACQWLHYFQSPSLLRAGFYDHVQKSKARILTDLMGINAQLPAALVQAAEDDPEARSMLQEEEALRQRIANAGNISEKLVLNTELKQLRRRMRTNPALVPINEIREGEAVKWAEVKQMGERLGGNVVFVDWVHASLGLSNGADLLLVIFADGRLLQATPLPLKMKEVDEWVAEQLQDDLPLSRETSERQLRTMNPLVAPLAKWTKPGQVLVFCPTRSLHRTPLHALRVDGKLLIERNPVVYSQSLSVLRMCQMAATASPAPAPRGRPLVLHPLHVGGAAHSQAQEIAALIGGHVVPEEDMSKEGVKRLLGGSGAPVVHFHGHVQFEESDPLHHRLELRIRAPLSPSPSPSPGPEDIDGGGRDGAAAGTGAGDVADGGRMQAPLSDADTLDADDIFDIRLPRPTHVTLVGCRSGRSVITGADNHLGLLTALHYAGASSVLSTLWKVDTEDAMELSKLFYGDFDGLWRRRHDGDEGAAVVVNLAVAMQKAVLRLRKRQKRPYHWAGFVLHGMWLLYL